MWSIFAVAASGLSGAGSGISASRGPHGGEARDARCGGVRRGHHLASLLSRGLSPIQSPNPESALDRWQRARGDRGHVCSDTKDCLLKINSRNGAAKKAKSKHRHARRFDAVVLRRPGKPNTSRAPPDHTVPPPLSVRHVPISNSNHNRPWPCVVHTSDQL